MSDKNAPISSTKFYCTACGYDVSASLVGGLCPECGKPIGESVKEIQMVEQPNSTAVNCMMLGIISIITCGAFSPFAFWLYFNAKREMAEGDFSQSQHKQANAGLIMTIISIFLLPILIMGIYVGLNYYW